MDREILFRGKRVDNGEWVEGYYVPLGDKYHYICTGMLTITNNVPTFEHFYVIPGTHGQYTGLTDKNGKKIFEGDIIKHNVMYSEGKTIKREDLFFTISYSIEQARFLALLPNGVFNPVAMQDCEVIGNIHDNSELLKGEEK